MRHMYLCLQICFSHQMMVNIVNSKKVTALFGSQHIVTSDGLNCYSQTWEISKLLLQISLLEMELITYKWLVTVKLMNNIGKEINWAVNIANNVPSLTTM